jgi:protease PrsW
MLWVLLAILFVVPLVLFYLLAIRSVDRFAPAPWWLLFLCLMWGSVGAVVPSVAASMFGQEVLDRAFDAELSENIGATFMAPLVEEPAKALGLLVIYAFARRRVHETHGALSGVVLGGTIGLGFTLTEDILYIVGAAEQAGGAGFIGVFFIRTIMLGMGHATFTAFTGLGFGLFATMTSGWRWAMPWLGLGAAMIAHAGRNLFSSFLTLDGFGVIMVLLLHALVMLMFFGLLIGMAYRDRKRVRTGLSGVVGVLITKAEYECIISPWMLVPGWNFIQLMGLPGSYQEAREKQLHCFQLAFIRNRARNEFANNDAPPVLDPVEIEAIAAIRTANARGVVLTRNIETG